MTWRARGDALRWGVRNPLRWRSVRQLSLFLGLAAVAVRSAPEGGAPTVGITGDWEIEVSAPGVAKPVRLRVAPAVVVEVKDERLPALEEWAVGKGVRRTKPAGLADPVNHGRFVLDRPSVTLRALPEAGGVAYELGKDFEADREWGGLGRMPGGRIAAGQPVLVSYRYHQRRLDAVFLTPAGDVVLRSGQPRTGSPRPPEAQSGERRLANLWVPERLAKLGPSNLFPILEEAFPEPPRTSPSPAERSFPRALRRLQDGQPLRLLAWGDSVTGGYLGKEQWPHQLVRRLQARFPQAKIDLVTAAWGGGNTRNFLTAPADHPLAYAQRVLGAKPDLVVSEFLNDSPLDAVETEARYRQVLADFRRIGAEWIIIAPHPSTFTNPPAEREVDDDPRAYVKMIRRFAPENGLALADAAARYGRLWRQGLPWTSLMGNSANHPDERGMAIFVDSVMALLP